MTIYYHTHHIVPKHMGGTDDPSNLIKLTVEEHAEAHRILYETYGKVEDKVAWLAISGRIKTEEAIRILVSSKARERMLSENNPMKKMRTNSGSFKNGRKYKMKDSHRENIRKAKLGKLNPNYGKIGIANHLNKSVYTCIHCGKKTTKGNIVRWHNDNCKHHQLSSSSASSST